MTKYVTGLYRDRDGVTRAIDGLLTAGFTRDDVSVLMSDQTRENHFAVVNKTKASEGVAAGGITGGVVGAVIAGLAAVGTLAIPGLGLLAVGPLVAALAGGGAGAAAGGLVGGLVGAGIPEHEAKLYDHEIRSGGILVGARVANSDQAGTARRILDAAGAFSVKKG